MERNLSRNVHSQLSDPEPLDLCRTELTRTNSDSSIITADDTSKDISHNCAAPFADQATKWTDQQHSLYLNSLEASFVNELNHSMCLRGWRVQNNLKEAYKSRTIQKSHNMSGQFLDGCWKKISNERNEPTSESTANSHVLAEFTDQNFKDEDQGARSSCVPMEKRLKTAPADDASRNDQVFPFGKFYPTDLSSNTKSSLEKKGQHELLSEHPESFHVPKSDLHYFLRGSQVVTTQN